MTEFRRRGVLAVVGVGVAVLVLLGIAFLLWGSRDTSPQAEPVPEAKSSVASLGPVGEPASHPESEGIDGKSTIHEQPVPPRPPELPEELAPLVDEKIALPARLGIIRGLGNTPNPETVDALFGILDYPPTHETVRNEICNRLERAETPGLPERLVAHLDRMVRDARHTPLWRDFCAQHLRECYVRHQVSEALDSLRWAAGEAEEPKVSSAGLYSLGLLTREMKWTGGDAGGQRGRRVARPDAAGEIAGKVGGEVIEEIDALARTALDPKSRVDTRTKAVRTIYIADRREFIPEIRKLLADGKEPLQLRNACASVLGQFRDPGSIPALEAAARSGPRRLKRTAERSLKKIREQPARAAGSAKGTPAAPSRGIRDKPHF